MARDDVAEPCPRCGGGGFFEGSFCDCPAGHAWRSSPRVTIGEDTLVFPPGTTRAQAQAVLDEAWRRYEEGAS